MMLSLEITIYEVDEWVKDVYLEGKNPGEISEHHLTFEYGEKEKRDFLFCNFEKVLPQWSLAAEVTNASHESVAMRMERGGVCHAEVKGNGIAVPLNVEAGVGEILFWLHPVECDLSFEVLIYNHKSWFITTLVVFLPCTRMIFLACFIISISHLKIGTLLYSSCTPIATGLIVRKYWLDRLLCKTMLI